jgi:D-glycero-D-manno-heptose 1,7-bisphosphate phosphatase
MTESPRDMHTARPAAFFDRDGVLIQDHGYVHKTQDLVLMPDAAAAVRLCNDAGFLVFVITNQAGVARGLYDEEAVRVFNRALVTALSAQGARIDDVRYCPHHPEATQSAYRLVCGCRKPAPGMLLDLMRAWPVDAGRSFLVGDKESDLAAGRAAGIASHLYRDGSIRAFIAKLLEAGQ